MKRRVSQCREWEQGLRAKLPKHADLPSPALLLSQTPEGQHLFWKDLIMLTTHKYCRRLEQMEQMRQMNLSQFLKIQIQILIQIKEYLQQQYSKIVLSYKTVVPLKIWEISQIQKSYTFRQAPRRWDF